jgi:hypothetical protein
MVQKAKKLRKIFFFENMRMLVFALFIPTNICTMVQNFLKKHEKNSQKLEF